MAREPRDLERREKPYQHKEDLLLHCMKAACWLAHWQLERLAVLEVLVLLSPCFWLSTVHCKNEINDGGFVIVSFSFVKDSYKVFLGF